MTIELTQAIAREIQGGSNTVTPGFTLTAGGLCLAGIGATQASTPCPALPSEFAADNTEAASNPYAKIGSFVADGGEGGSGFTFGSHIASSCFWIAEFGHSAGANVRWSKTQGVRRTHNENNQESSTTTNKVSGSVTFTPQYGGEMLCVVIFSSNGGVSGVSVGTGYTLNFAVDERIFAYKIIDATTATAQCTWTTSRNTDVAFMGYEPIPYSPRSIFIF